MESRRRVYVVKHFQLSIMNQTPYRFYCTSAAKLIISQHKYTTIILLSKHTIADSQYHKSLLVKRTRLRRPLLSASTVVSLSHPNTLVQLSTVCARTGKYTATLAIQCAYKYVYQSLQIDLKVGLV